MGAKYLIAHSDTVTNRALEIALREQDHDLRVARGGLDAVDRALDDKPDAIILGMDLPGLNGLEVARVLRAIKPTQQIPILFVAHDAQEAASVERAGLPLVDCVIGPLDPARIREQGAKLLRVSLPAEPHSVEPERPLAAISDRLTGLYARHYLLHRLSYEAARAARYSNALSCILFGVDHYKTLIEDLGRVSGDHLLVEIASLFRRSARASDVIGRASMDEFLTIAPHTDSVGALNLAVRLRELMRAYHMDLPAKYLPLRISVGYASAPGPSLADNLALLGRAEGALLRARMESDDKVVVG